MALTPSNMLPLGTIAPYFELVDTVSNKKLNLHELKSPIATVIMFICNHCPYVKHIQTEIVALAKEYKAKNISFVAISSNDITHYPEDAPEKMQHNAQQLGFTFPYLFMKRKQSPKLTKPLARPIFIFLIKI